MSTTITTPSPDYVEETTTFVDVWMAKLQAEHPEITFIVPNHHDMQHIDNMVNFKKMLEQVGNTAYDTVHATTSPSPISSPSLTQHVVDAAGQSISSEQISKSVVLDLADLRDNAMSGLERFFAGADIHAIINYLWIGVVTSLVILSVIFIVFSIYFYRKFREWKKCNKDISAQLNNDLYTDSLMAHCEARGAEAAYYQMESPPCYTIATGLPTYDEALHHQQHFAFGMRFVYPTLAAVHHQAAHLVSSWEKYDLRVEERLQQQQHQQEQHEKSLKSYSVVALDSTPGSCPLPSYDVAAGRALLSVPEKSEAVSICMAHDSSSEPLTTDHQTSNDCNEVFIV